MGWERHLLAHQNVAKRKDPSSENRSNKNWPIQANASDILRAAILLMDEHHIETVALVHDAVMIHVPIPELKQTVALAKNCMIKGAVEVLGAPIPVDEKTYFSNFKQKEKDIQEVFEVITKHVRDKKAEIEFYRPRASTDVVRAVSVS